MCEEICRDVDMLHPIARPAFAELLARLGALHRSGRLPVEFRLYETFRSPLRQAYLMRSVLAAQPYESPHQFGLAAELVVWSEGRWSWDSEHPWDRLEIEADRAGLSIPVRWDRSTVVHPRWFILAEILTK